MVQVELRDDDTVNVLCQRFPHCWLLGATVRDSWLVMAATLWGCWRWHLGAIVRDCWLGATLWESRLVMAATLWECWHWHRVATVRDSWPGLGVTVLDWSCGQPAG